MKRSFLQAPLHEGEIVMLDELESHHLLNVRRSSREEQIVLINGQGEFATAVIEGSSAKRARCRLLKVERTEKKPKITLFLSLIKKKSLSWAVEKCCEIGVAKIVLLSSDRSQSLEGGKRLLHFLERVAIDGLKQSGHLFLPLIEQPQPLKKILQTAPPAFFASLHAESSLVYALTQKKSHPTSIAIGPEGGWSPEEEIAFSNHGWQPVSLAATTLRSETAAICALFLLDQLSPISFTQS